MKRNGTKRAQKGKPLIHSKPQSLMMQSKRECRSWSRPDLYPPVHTDTFSTSATTSLVLIEQIGKFLAHVRDSKPYAAQLMDAAQRGNTPEVERLILSQVQQVKVETAFTPDTIRITFKRSRNDLQCCKVDVLLQWNP